ncbi:sensor histidine kinase [Henriciella marina]|uniref:sensor histidine kinase n=1 Tax=Henriciella marina TaxID=453851 RepID=UPI0003732F6C|nr:histidine kinase dimerization/phosphoacceptor domain -containing protein [Henriciella marina]
MSDYRERIELAVLDQLGEGVILADRDGKIVTVNRAAEVIHGRSQLDVEPDDYSDSYELLTLDDDPYPAEKLPLTQAVVHGRTVTDVPWKIKRPDGSVVIAVGTARPILDASGKQIAAVLTMRDETLRYHAEQSLKEALEVKETLLYEVNHRVRNSLQVVSSIVSMHMRTVKDADAREALEAARRRIDVITATHRSLYELGTHDWVDCSHLLPDLCKQVADTFSRDNAITLKCKKTGVIVLAVSQAVSLCLAVTELMINACKYAFDGRDGGRIELVLEASDDQIIVSVSDNGVGIKDPEDGAKTGIGSMIVSSLAHSLDATIERKTGPDGTTFTISFAPKLDNRRPATGLPTSSVYSTLDHWESNRLA